MVRSRPRLARQHPSRQSALKYRGVSTVCCLPVRQHSHTTRSGRSNPNSNYGVRVHYATAPIPPPPPSNALPNMYRVYITPPLVLSSLRTCTDTASYPPNCRADLLSCPRDPRVRWCAHAHHSPGQLPHKQTAAIIEGLLPYALVFPCATA